ncbi:unnamed protein product [Hapterophycus canaliculatus]
MIEVHHLEPARRSVRQRNGSGSRRFLCAIIKKKTFRACAAPSMLLHSEACVSFSILRRDFKRIRGLGKHLNAHSVFWCVPVGVDVEHAQLFFGRDNRVSMNLAVCQESDPVLEI